MSVNVSVHNVCKEDYAWNPRICACEIDKYLKQIMFI